MFLQLAGQACDGAAVLVKSGDDSDGFASSALCFPADPKDSVGGGSGLELAASAAVYRVTAIGAKSA